MTTNGKCFLCGTPLATPEQIDRHICDVCGAMVKDNAALNMILLRALYMAAGADILKAAICSARRVRAQALHGCWRHGGANVHRGGWRVRKVQERELYV